MRLLDIHQPRSPVRPPHPACDVATLLLAWQPGEPWASATEITSSTRRFAGFVHLGETVLAGFAAHATDDGDGLLRVRITTARPAAGAPQ